MKKELESVATTIGKTPWGPAVRYPKFYSPILIIATIFMLPVLLWGRPVGGDIGRSNSNWIILKSGGGWTALGDQQMYDSMESANNNGLVIAGVSLGHADTNWAYWTTGGGWSARGDQSMLDSISTRRSSGARITGIELGYNSTTWAYWDEFGGWGARGDSDLQDGLNGVIQSNGRVAGISLGHNATTWAYWTQGGGWGVRGDPDLISSLNDAYNQGAKIAGIEMGPNSTTWAYWTQGGGWGARGDSDLLNRLQTISNSGSTINSIIFGPTSSDWIVFYGNGGWAAKGDSQLLDALRAASELNVATPVITPNGGVYLGSVQVSISTSTSSAVIRYTLNGTTPNEFSPIYAGPFTLTSNATLRARAYRSGYTPSEVALATFTVSQEPVAAIPVITPGGGTYTGQVQVSISTTTAFSTIRYTTDDSTPNEFSPIYSGPFALSSSATVKAKAYAPNHTPSSVVTRSFTIVPTQGTGGNGVSNRIRNMSVRTHVGTGADVLIVGYSTYTGSSSSSDILIRGIGPTLSRYGVPDVLQDPVLSHFHGQTLSGTNDDWWAGASSQVANIQESTERVRAFSLNSNSMDSALYATVNSAPRTVHLGGFGTSTGAGMVELYIADPTKGGGFSNLSARAGVGGTKGPLIAGFYIDYPAAQKVLIRGVGPTLSNYNVDGVIPDPVITLFSGSNQIARNDDWNTSANLNELQSAMASVGAFNLSSNRDSAMLVTLAAGKTYTVHLSDLGGLEGIGLIEVYAVE